jgi:hypothetical protein
MTIARSFIKHARLPEACTVTRALRERETSNVRPSRRMRSDRADTFDVRILEVV